MVFLLACSLKICEYQRIRECFERGALMFFGRKNEIELLQEPNWRKEAQLILVYGRRRIGKTALIEYAFGEETMWKFDGLEGVGQKAQIEHFLRQLTFTNPIDNPLLNNQHQRTRHSVDNWEGALQLLVQNLQPFRDKPLVIFFDEFQWLAGMRSKLVSLFKSYWDNYFSKFPYLRIVLCGSISSFMVKKVLRSKALYGRVSTEINLKALSISEAAMFFDGKRSKAEMFEIAMCVGCIPQYLKELNPKLSFAQNLNEYAFSQQGYFFGEYHRLFISHFGKKPAFAIILRALSKAPSTAQKLAAACHVSSGGTFSNMLFDLELAGFIERYTPLSHGRKSKLIRYRLDDEYLHFYFSFIEPHVDEIMNGKFTATHFYSSREFQQWQGYAFERLARKYAPQIADHLRFSGIRYKYGSWFSSPTENSHGAQIDLLFERADRVITVCEIKYNTVPSPAKLINNFETKLIAIDKAYPNFGQQKVLILGKQQSVSVKVEQYFDEVLYGADIFFQ